MVGVVLHIQSNQSLGNSVDNSKSPGWSAGNPEVLKEEEKGNVERTAEMPSKGSKFSTTTNNLEHLTLDLSLKLRIKLVSETKRKLSMSQHFFAYLSIKLQHS